MGAHRAVRVHAGFLRSEQETMRHARQVNKHVHPIVDEMRDPETLADRRLVTPLAAEMKRLRVEAKCIEQPMFRKPETRLFLRPRAAFRHDANALSEPFAPETRQRVECALDCGRLQKSIREKRGV